MQEVPSEIYKSCYLRGIKLLSMREYSEKKLRQKLIHLEYQEDVIDLAINELKLKSYLQDDRFKEVKCRYLLRSGMGPEQIIPKLKEDGIEVTRVELDFMREELGINVDEQITSLIAQKLSKSAFKKIDNDFKLISKLYQHLISRGFRLSIDQIKEAVRTHKESNSQ